MTSRIVEPSELLDDEYDTIEDTEALDAPETTEASSEEVESKVPEKFKGKSPEEIAEAYLNLEKEYGRRSQEIGELRSLADNFIQQELNKKPKVEEDPISDDDFLVDPAATVGKAVKSDPVVRQLQEQLQSIQRENAMSSFNARHPNWQETAATEQFNNWVMASPYRQSLYQKANSFDFTAADELFNIYSDMNATPKAESTKDTMREDALKKATSEKGSSGGGKSRKVYRRADLIRLRNEDPSKYEAMESEIMAAYAEGRIK